MPDFGGGYAMNPQQAQMKADRASQAADTRATPEEAGYLELEGAQKDSDCQLVNVPGGVSSQGGCCNLWDTVPKADRFACGACTKITGQGSAAPEVQSADAGGGDSGGITDASMSASPQVT